MPFGFLKKLVKKHATDAVEKYAGEGAGDFVGGAIDQGFDHFDNDGASGGGGGGGGVDIGGLLSSFTGGQQNGLTSLFSNLGGSTSAMEDQASSKGLDPALISSMVGLLSKSSGGGGSGGFDLPAMLSIAQGLTKSGSGSASGGGGAGGFLNLISGVAGGGSGGDGTGSSNNILQVLIGIAKSFFGMKMGKDPALSAWGDAGARDSGSFKDWGMHLIKDLIFPGKKEKEVIDEDPDDQPTPGGKDGVKGWFDGHPEIGKMQKDIFDDIFDTTDGDGEDEDRPTDDPSPIIPTPTDIESDCSILDHASILFLNTNILLELRKNWRFLYSTASHPRSFEELVSRISLKGPTLVIVRDSEGNVFGAFTSTSWADSEGGWIGNGDSFVFAIKPKMAVFHSTGKDENIMYLTGDEGLGLGGRVGRFGLSLNADLESGSYHGDVDTFDLHDGMFGEEFDVDHVEVWGLGPEPDPDSERSRLDVRKPNLNITGGGNVDMDDLLGQIS